MSEKSNLMVMLAGTLTFAVLPLHLYTKTFHTNETLRSLLSGIRQGVCCFEDLCYFHFLLICEFGLGRLHPVLFENSKEAGDPGYFTLQSRLTEMQAGTFLACKSLMRTFNLIFGL